MGFVDDWPEIRQGSWHAEEELPPWPKRQDQPATADDVTRVRAPRKDAVKDGVKPARLDETVILREETGLLGFLIVKRGSQRGTVYPIKHGATVGGSGADVVLGDPTVDAVHAKFTIEEECFYVWDFGTEHGTSVNGAKIREATPVQENDIIGFGQTELELKTLQ
jgi:pSer/pThr/pTyr-binding forkhead associated (FHA) protein